MPDAQRRGRTAPAQDPPLGSTRREILFVLGIQVLARQITVLQRPGASHGCRRAGSQVGLATSGPPIGEGGGGGIWAGTVAVGGFCG